MHFIEMKQLRSIYFLSLTSQDGFLDDTYIILLSMYMKLHVYETSSADFFFKMRCMTFKNHLVEVKPLRKNFSRCFIPMKFIFSIHFYLMHEPRAFLKLSYSYSSVFIFQDCELFMNSICVDLVAMGIE